MLNDSENKCNASSIMLHLSSVKHTCTKLFTRIGGCVREKEESSGDESFSDRSAYLDAPWDLKSEFPITQ
jgi:hypothetical protein